MLKVKLFDEENENDLEEAINQFFETIDEHQLIDIKYQVALAEDSLDEEYMVYCYSAMIIYRL
ncbi:sporulation protein Cse60 [Pseudalkalibacillus caeni]|uniref:Sporulation protein Cse60 n=1 Tax=Exobacillus caeni TaxID=2574798 RepID=A0A5R9F5L4_9BACL|nr:sporulation protein Cse60 [Pseudalkalibacillus caeni]TLS39042.1 sporulation protein Cse60 [Pseudalkalibacillus caeni]